MVLPDKLYSSTTKASRIIETITATSPSTSPSTTITPTTDSLVSEEKKEAATKIKLYFLLALFVILSLLLLCWLCLRYLKRILQPPTPPSPPSPSTILQSSPDLPPLNALTITQVNGNTKIVFFSLKIEPPRISHINDSKAKKRFE
jgi:hypothetical protein